MTPIENSSTSSTITVTLGKRKRRDSLVIHLSSPAPSTENDPTYTESEPEHQFEHVSGLLTATSGSRTSKRRYVCTFEGCTRAYTKPSRLAEHQRSHTGVRPFVCSVCNKSYLREGHLQAHARTHLPSSAKPFACPEEGCGKRFWTSQHLNVHIESHRGEKPFKCTEEGCDAAFSKHHQLRDHICTVHSPPGTKPYRCEHVGCTKSFATNQKLSAHLKTHDDKRYTCVHRSCLPPDNTEPTYYATWSALQHHTRTVHPPTCPYASCNGKTFSQQKGLRAHLKIHAQQEQEGDIDDAPGSEMEGERPRKRRRGGEVGRDWICEVDGCDKDFKSKKALTTHHNIAHLGRRDFVCPHEHCKRAFGYKHLLQRHLAKLHAPQSASSDHDEAADVEETEPETDTGADIDFLTGKAYIAHAQESLKQAAKLQCPFPHLPPQLYGEMEQVASSSKQAKTCQYVFSRAYDLRRHLHAEHGVDVARDRVDDWVRGKKRTGGTMSRQLVS